MAFSPLNYFLLVVGVMQLGGPRSGRPLPQYLSHLFSDLQGGIPEGEAEISPMPVHSRSNCPSQEEGWHSVQGAPVGGRDPRP